MLLSEFSFQAYFWTFQCVGSHSWHSGTQGQAGQAVPLLPEEGVNLCGLISVWDDNVKKPFQMVLSGLSHLVNRIQHPCLEPVTYFH